MFPLSQNSAYEYINYDFSLIPIRRSIIYKYVFVEQKLHFNAEEINMIERNIQARLIFEQNKIMNLYSRHNKSCTESIIPMEIDDGNASFNSLHYNDIIISLENTASKKVSLSSKNEICKNKDRNRVINNSDFVYEDEPEKILLHIKIVNCENMNEQTEDDNNLQENGHQQKCKTWGVLNLKNYTKTKHYVKEKHISTKK